LICTDVSDERQSVIGHRCASVVTVTAVTG
jgi:hypothetical protein